MDWQIRESLKAALRFWRQSRFRTSESALRNRGWEEAQPWGAAPGWESVLRNLFCVVRRLLESGDASGVRTKDIPEGWQKQIRNGTAYAKRPNNFRRRQKAKTELMRLRVCFRRLVHSSFKEHVTMMGRHELNFRRQDAVEPVRHFRRDT